MTNQKDNLAVQAIRFPENPIIHAGLDEQIGHNINGVTHDGQRSFLATSHDGLRFHAMSEVLGPWYFRTFQHEAAWFAIAKATDTPGGGVLLRSSDAIQPFEQGPDILPNQRHVAVLKRGSALYIFFSRGKDCPEPVSYTHLRAHET